MYFKLPKQNTFKVGEEVFGKYLRENGFVYNKTYKYWYRALPDVIQFIGIAKYSAGMHDISFLCTPYFIPLSLGEIEDKKGRSPKLFEGGEAAMTISRMQLVGQFTQDHLTTVYGIEAFDPEQFERIKLQMKVAFDTVVKPAIESATNIGGCYELCMKLNTLFLEVRKLVFISPRDQSPEKEVYFARDSLMASEIEIYCLLAMHQYKAASIRMAEDEWSRNEMHATIWPFKDLKELLDHNATEEIDHMLAKQSAQTKDALRSYGFILCDEH